MQNIVRPLSAACAAACAGWAPLASAGIITDSVQVIDANFVSQNLPIGPGDTNVGSDRGIFGISADPAGSTLIVNGGSVLSAGRLVTMSTPSQPPSQVIISGAGSTLEILGAQQTGRAAIDFASQGTSNLTITGGGQLSFSSAASGCTQTQIFPQGPACFVANFGNAAGSNANVVVSGAGSRLDLNPDNLDPGTFHVTNIGGAIVTNTGFVMPGGDSTATVSILNGATFDTDFAAVAGALSGNANTGTESITSFVTVSGAGSTWNSGGMVIGNRVDPNGTPVPETAPDVSGTVIVANGGVINSAINVFDDGVLAGNGTVVGNIINSGGVIAPGLSPGVLTIDGDFLMDRGQLLIEIAGLAPGLFDTLAVSGLIDISGGDIFFDFLDGFVPSLGFTVPFLSAGGGISIADSVTFGFGGLGAGYEFEIDRTSGAFITRATPVPEPETLALLALGLGALCWWRRSGRAAA